MNKKIFASGEWTIMRWIRLLFGVFILIEAMVNRDWLLGIGWLFLAGMAVVNVGCNSGCCLLTSGSCSVAPRENRRSPENPGTIEREAGTKGYPDQTAH